MQAIARKLLLVMTVLGLCSLGEVARADQGCELITVMDFFQHVVLPGANCLYSVDRGLYECSKGATQYDLSIEDIGNGDGRGHAVRSDGFTLVFTCSCTRICEYEDPAP